MCSNTDGAHWSLRGKDREANLCVCRGVGGFFSLPPGMWGGAVKFQIISHVSVDKLDDVASR